MNLLVDGFQFGKRNDDCYIGVISTNIESSPWYIGVQMLQELMLVFDNSQDAGPRIGIGYGKIGEALRFTESMY